MQIFLPYPSILDSIECLDNKRLRAMTREASQIYRAATGLTEGYKNHPLVHTWRHIGLNILKYYGYHAARVCKERGLKPYYEMSTSLFNEEPVIQGVPDTYFLKYQQHLKAKDPEHYDFDVEAKPGYWAVCKPKDADFCWKIYGVTSGWRPHEFTFHNTVYHLNIVTGGFQNGYRNAEN